MTNWIQKNPWLYITINLSIIILFVLIGIILVACYFRASYGELIDQIYYQTDEMYKSILNR